MKMSRGLCDIVQWAAVSKKAKQSYDMKAHRMVAAKNAYS
jgi:hypothetical protein